MNQINIFISDTPGSNQPVKKKKLFASLGKVLRKKPKNAKSKSLTDLSHNVVRRSLNAERSNEIKKTDSFKSQESGTSTGQDEYLLENFMDSVDGNDSGASYQDIAGEDDENDSLASRTSSIMNNENYDNEENYDHILIEKKNSRERDGSSLAELLDLNTEISTNDRFEKMPVGTTVSFKFHFLILLLKTSLFIYLLLCAK